MLSSGSLQQRPCDHHRGLLYPLYSLDLVGHHHRVLLADLGGGLGFVVIGAVVLVRVPVDPAEEVAAAAVEPWVAQSNTQRSTAVCEAGG